MNPRPDPFAPETPRPPRQLLMWSLALVYLLVGLIGHDPWRGDDARNLGPALAMLADNQWLIPHIVGEPFFDYPPLYYWFGALTGSLTAWLLPLADAVRLASALLVGLTLWLTANSARRLYGDHAHAAALLLSLGTLGLVVHAHETQPLLAVMFAQAVTYWGYAVAQRHAGRGALIAGLGVGLAFLANGVAAVVVTLPALFFLPGVAAIGLSLAAAVITAGLWLLAAGLSEPALLGAWWQAHLAEIAPHGRNIARADKLVGLLGWFAWPLWPIAGWALWRERRRLSSPGWPLLIVTGVLSVLVIALSGSLRPASALPVLVPLALMAAAGVTTLRRGAANAFNWFAGMCFAAFALLLWIAWTSMSLSWPPGLARHLNKIAPNFVLVDPLLPSVLGVLLCMVWILLLWTARRGPYRGAINWAAGMTMLWCLAVLLLQPWFEHNKSYRTAATSLAAALDGQKPVCIAQVGLSPSLRVALDYHTGLRTVPYSAETAQCSHALVYGEARPAALSGPWRARWLYQRGGGNKLEVLRLYERVDDRWAKPSPLMLRRMGTVPSSR